LSIVSGFINYTEHLKVFVQCVISFLIEISQHF